MTAIPATPCPRRRRAVQALATLLVATAGSVAPPADPATADSVHFLEYTTTTAGPLGSVTFIGDSVGIGAGRFAPRLSDRLEDHGWGPVRFHAVDGKRTGYPPGWPDHFNAVPLIDQWQAAGWDSDTWIINLGANDSGFCSRDVACARASIMLVVDAIGPGHRIWWPKITRLYTYQHQADAWNAALDQIAAERADFSTWDWPAEMRSHPDIYGSWDGTHLYPDGYRHRSMVMAEAFTAAVARATRTGPDAPLPAATGAPSELVVDRPVRVVDTRPGAPARLRAGATLTVDLSDHVPASATAVALNVTAVRPAADGFLTATPCTGGPPATSSLNHGRHTRAAPVVVPLSPNRTVCITSAAATDVIVDLQAAFVPAGTTVDDSDPGVRLRLDPLARPTRLLDTRETGRATRLTVAVPDRPAGAVVNLTVTRAEGPGYVSAAPCAEGAADTSNVNVVPGETLAASAFVPLGADGTFCVTASTALDVVVDLTGTLDADAALAFVPAGPARLLDTRNGHGGWGPVHGAGDVVDIRAAPPDAGAMTGTITIVRPRERGFLAAVPCGRQAAGSSVNGAGGDIVANSLTVAVDAEQRLCVTASTTGHTLVDLAGWWVP